MEKFLINDINKNIDAKKLLMEKFNLTILDGPKMTKILLAWPEWKNFNPWTTLIVFPGNGSLVVKNHIEKENRFWFCKWPWKSFPNAKRIWIPGQNPKATVSRVNPGVLVGIKKVIVIDDVISSGETVKKLYKKNKTFIPTAKWQAVTWVKQKSALTKGFSQVFTVNTVGTDSYKVPVNSLSTLIERRDIAKSYAYRNFGSDAELFLKIIKNFR